MAEELCIEMQPRKSPLHPLRNRKAIIIIALIALVIAAGLYSWWLSGGKISSVSANLDTVVYTVDSDLPALVSAINVRPGETVAAGQVLGQLNMAELAQFLRERRYNLARQGLIPPLPEVTERLNEAQKYEKQIAAKLAQAQAVEERLNAIMQDSVTDHVRAQLQMRAQPQHSAAWQAASRVEREMFAKMEKARVDHDQARKVLNAIAAEHVKISSEIARKKSNPGQFFNEILDSKPLPDMGNGNLYAPVAGKILLVNFAVGQRIDSVTPLFVILPTSTKDASDVWIQALFPLKDAKKIEAGQKVSIRFEKSGIHVSGHVTAVSNEAQALPATQSQAKPTSINHLAASEDDSDRNAARYVPVRIAPNNPSELAGLDPGATASCQIQTRYVLGHNLF